MDFTIADGLFGQAGDYGITITVTVHFIDMQPRQKNELSP
jgi:hypothetical protein